MDDYIIRIQAWSIKPNYTTDSVVLLSKNREEFLDFSCYLPFQSNEKLIRALCQKSYDQKLLSAAKHALVSLQKVSSLTSAAEFRSIYDKETPARKLMITPYILSDEDFVRCWKAAHTTQHTFREQDKVYNTDQNERYFSLLLARRTPIQIQITQSVSVFFLALGTKNTDANIKYPVCIGICLAIGKKKTHANTNLPHLRSLQQQTERRAVEDPAALVPAWLFIGRAQSGLLSGRLPGLL